MTMINRRDDEEGRDENKIYVYISLSYSIVWKKKLVTVYRSHTTCLKSKVTNNGSRDKTKSRLNHSTSTISLGSDLSNGSRRRSRTRRSLFRDRLSSRSRSRRSRRSSGSRSRRRSSNYNGNRSRSRRNSARWAVTSSSSRTAYKLTSTPRDLVTIGLSSLDFRNKFTIRTGDTETSSPRRNTIRTW